MKSSAIPAPALPARQVKILQSSFVKELQFNLQQQSSAAIEAVSEKLNNLKNYEK